MNVNFKWWFWQMTAVMYYNNKWLISAWNKPLLSVCLAYEYEIGICLSFHKVSLKPVCSLFLSLYWSRCRNLCLGNRPDVHVITRDTFLGEFFDWSQTVFNECLILNWTVWGWRTLLTSVCFILKMPMGVFLWHSCIPWGRHRTRMGTFSNVQSLV